jgi:hypothetical protein
MRRARQLLVRRGADSYEQSNDDDVVVEAWARSSVGMRSRHAARNEKKKQKPDVGSRGIGSSNSHMELMTTGSNVLKYIFHELI